MFYDRIPHDQLTTLAAMTYTLGVDLDALEEMTAYAVRADTHGLVHEELARAFVPDQGRLRRLHRAGLIHDPYEAAGCCGMPAERHCWTIHRPVLEAAML
jgi:hypothetical protein